MDNESFVSTIRDPQAKKVLYEILKRLEKLEAEQAQNSTVIPMQKGSEMLRELGFKSKRPYDATFPEETA